VVATTAVRDWPASDPDPEALGRGPLFQLTRTLVEERGYDRQLSGTEQGFMAESTRAADAQPRRHATTRQLSRRDITGRQ
jgi:hypothetical protein